MRVVVPVPVVCVRLAALMATAVISLAVLIRIAPSSWVEVPPTAPPNVTAPPPAPFRVNVFASLA